MELKLLIVEDDRLLAEAVSDYFTGKSWETDVVYDGDSAVEKAERKSYQMILLDVMLPGRDGFSVCRKIRGMDCPLAPKEYEMLLLFLRNPNRTFTRDQLLTRLWGYDFEGNERVVDNHIKKLRKALEGSTCRIHTVRNTGYRMEVSI
ncbi:response regulator transcription factor [Mediterraneibacter glycyrrhizinilyticus]|uniref:response regulator transcription factor n=1 Tax=Mediterraneibacter glycyrrhizinilyticus TaxID=342942 RepID=UPI00265A4A6D|nr:response regulator transcription factor [Mediterraneibacter glycyrrhizinilyticus]MCF2568628.1 response regulator transcription factor [Mediterraneibacter glycyrrhizinilyticus]